MTFVGVTTFEFLFGKEFKFRDFIYSLHEK